MAVMLERLAHELDHRVAEDERDDRESGRDPDERLGAAESQPSLAAARADRACDDRSGGAHASAPGSSSPN